MLTIIFEFGYNKCAVNSAYHQSTTASVSAGCGNDFAHEWNFLHLRSNSAAAMLSIVRHDQRERHDRGSDRGSQLNGTCTLCNRPHKRRTNCIDACVDGHGECQATAAHKETTELCMPSSHAYYVDDRASRLWRSVIFNLVGQHA